MAYRHLTIEKDGHVVTCTMANPPTHTMVAGEVTELHAFLDEVEQDRDIRVVVFTGADPDIFIAHYEVGELAHISESIQGAETDEAEGPPAPPAPPPAPVSVDDLHPVNTLCLRLEGLAAITVAAINGNAAGGGCEFSLACDFRLIKDGDYHYGLPETSVGILPGAGGTQRFARLLGSARALDLILHARLLSPREAFELGLVHRLYAAADFSDAVAAFAADLASRAPIALAQAKRAIYRGRDLPMAEALALEQGAFNACMASADAARAMRQWLEHHSFAEEKPFAWEGK